MNWLQFDLYIQLIILLAADARLFMPALNSLYISTLPYSKKGKCAYYYYFDVESGFYIVLF
jgi:hypothetical protein